MYQVKVSAGVKFYKKIKLMIDYEECEKNGAILYRVVMKAPQILESLNRDLSKGSEKSVLWISEEKSK